MSQRRCALLCGGVMEQLLCTSRPCCAAAAALGGAVLWGRKAAAMCGGSISGDRSAAIALLSVSPYRLLMTCVHTTGHSPSRDGSLQAF